MMQSSKVVSSNTQLKQQLGQCQMNQKTSTSVEMKASSISTQSMNTTAKKPALPASNSQVNQKCDKKSGKKHALGKLLDKGRQQRNEENAKKSVSLNDFLMDFN
ncbi:hypothetical protein BDF22DRAFT_730551 [Syncephalis plumigaleata]|nr:hypothetical protein BDF22DRAFT_730551 [Syncephalis plumigaleata]